MIRNSLFASLLCMATISFYCYGNDNGIDSFQCENYILKIKVNCPQGNVFCEDVTMTSKNLKDNYIIELKGRAINANCPDSCDFRGYFFEKDEYKYYFYPEDNEYYVLTSPISYYDIYYLSTCSNCLAFFI